jgi:hypothetical protein
MSSVIEGVERYEKWLKTQCKVVEAGLATKHERMRDGPFAFLRATFFRWAGTIEAVCPDLADAPKVLCVGDAHVENFGMWHDAEARRVWGVNDFDEAAVMPYAYDLVRLVASAGLAPNLDVKPAAAAKAVLAGYREGIGDPAPMLLDQGAAWPRGLRDSKDAQTASAFWRDIEKCEDASPPSKVQRALRRSLPPGAAIRRFAQRQKGGGSLGRPRYLVVARWQGGFIAREAKAMVPSAWDWAHSKTGRLRQSIDLAFAAYRSPDPSVGLSAGFLLRRVAPDTRKLELGDVASRGLGAALLEAMGRDIGSIHAAHRRAGAVIDDLARRDADWLDRASVLARDAVEADCGTWQSKAVKD